MKRKTALIALAAITVVMVVIDRLSKAWAADALGASISGIDLGPISLVLVHNFGAAFGMGQGARWVFVLIAIAIMAGVLIWFLKIEKHTPLETMSLSLIFAGGLGNMIDRLTTVYVVDFIRFDFIDFPVFNVADCCVTIGVVLLFIWLLFFSGDILGNPEDSASTHDENRGE